MSRIHASIRPITVALALLAPGCAAERLATPPPVPSTTVTSAAPMNAHEMVLGANACWFGGVWNDALDTATPPASRCAAVLRAAHGSVDPVRLERLRATESIEVNELGDEVRRVAEADPTDRPRAEALVRLLGGIAAAHHEQMLARRAAHRVKMDMSGERDRSRRVTDERSGASELGSTSALKALLLLDLPPELSAEARTVSVMLVTDRMHDAVDLPKHLKLILVGGAFHELFGVEMPVIPSDPATPMAGGTWLGYLSDVARAAGHPVPSFLTDLVDREGMAWAGAVGGLSDRLRLESERVPEPNELRRAASAIVKRLDTEYRAREASLVERELGTP